VRKESKKRFQVNEQEANWGGFLVDADAVASLPFFDRAKEAAAHDDPDIVSEAWDQCRCYVKPSGFSAAYTRIPEPRQQRGLPRPLGIAGNSERAA
jgi:hypothetical protein